MENRLMVITDSTADLPKEFIDQHNVQVVPLYVNFKDKTYQDGVDLHPQEFYPLLKEAKNDLPRTSTPSINDFIDVYKPLVEKGFEIISIHISSGLSGTVSIAEAAAKTLNGKIHVFDSKSISLGIGLQVLETIEMIKQNLNAEKIMHRLQEIRQRTEVLFSLDTLEYLHKGGRIGKVSSLLGTILNIKPIVRVENGVYIPLDKVRNQKQAIKRAVEHMLEILGDNIPRHVAVAHGASEEAAQCLVDLVKEKLQIDISLFRETGPVIGVHTGPGTLGLAFTY